MAYNNKSFGGRSGFGKKPGGFRPPFRPGGFNNSRMFSATCASCGKPCEVPFKPNGSRPVYCNECFNKNGGDNRNDGRTFKRDFNRDPQPGNDALNDIKTALAMMNIKLDKLMETIEFNKPQQNVVPTEESIEDTVEDVEEKPSKKKAVSKKK